MQGIDSIYLSTREQWREWLQEYYKKHTGKPSVPYNDAVEEALCFGWIDSTVRRIDAERYMQKFTPRKMKSSWSVSNVIRVKKLTKQGKMTAKGLELYQFAKKQNLLPGAIFTSWPHPIDAIISDGSWMQNRWKRNYADWVKPLTCCQKVRNWG